MATLASRLEEILIFPRTEESLDSLIAGDEESQSLQLSLDDGADIEQEIDRFRLSQQVQRLEEKLPSREQIIFCCSMSRSVGRRTDRRPKFSGF